MHRPHAPHKSPTHRPMPARQALSLGTFALGVGIKSSSLPERLVQRRWCDIFLTSHQLWHVAIHVGFALGTFLAWDEYLVWRRTHQCGVVTYY